LSTVSVLRELIIDTHAWFEATTADVTEEQAHWRPPGIANPIAAIYAHAIVGADFGLNSIIQQRPPLIAADWGGKAGLSELMPIGEWHDWATGVQMDLDVFRNYASSVYLAWANYLASLSDADLEQSVDLSAFDMGQRRLSQYLSMQVQHFSGHCGEIACLKGLQGAAGFRPGTAEGIG